MRFAHGFSLLLCAGLWIGAAGTAYGQSATPNPDTAPTADPEAMEGTAPANPDAGPLSQGFDAFPRPSEAVPAEADETATSDETESSQGTPPATEESTETETVSEPAPSGVQLGKLGYDAAGQPGRVHVVVKGDTLWDISDAYLGTPWVWPSVWLDNQNIANPHLINPGDHIWITPNEMRRITPEEAEAYLAGGPAPDPTDDVPAAFDETVNEPEVPLPPAYRYSELHTTGFTTKEQFEGAATIVDAQTTKVWLSDPDRVLIGWGRGETQVGDRYAIVRPGARIVHRRTYETLGYETEMLGWLEVNEVHEDTSTATIRVSRHEIRRGDHIIPWEEPDRDITLQPTPHVDGSIVHMPHGRTEAGSTDVVFLDRGREDGLVAGSPLEVYRPMDPALDEIRMKKMNLPDHVVAKLLVVSVNPKTAVAVVTHTEDDLTKGDRFRGSNSLR